MTTTTIDIPRIWVGCLSCYNDGQLSGDWGDLDGDRDNMTEAIAAVTENHNVLSVSPHEEWMAFDRECLPSYVGESIVEAVDAAEAMTLLADDFDAPMSVLAGLMDNVGGVVDAGNVIYHGKYDSIQDLAEEQVDAGLYGPIPEAIESFIDYTSIGRDLDASGVFAIDDHYWETI